jgi:phosphatidylglycerol lysyltransferase
MIKKAKRLLPFAMLGLFLLALYGVFRQLHGHHWHDMVHAMRQIPSGQIGRALLFTVISYMVMTGYDMLALRYIRHPLKPTKTVLASFLGYAFSNNVGFAMLAGASVRYRIYTAWGLSAVEITQVVLFCTVSVWVGFMGLAGALFLFEPLPFPRDLHLPFASARPFGAILLLILACYFVLIFLSRKAIAFKGWRFSLPSRSVAAGQLMIAAVDWLLAGLVLFSLWPQPSGITFVHFMAIFLVAQLGGLISQVPGGLGVFESIILLLAPSALPAPRLLGALIVYRGTYYLLPLLVGVVMLGLEEALRRKAMFEQLRGVAERVWAGVFAPILSLAVFLSGALLLFSGSLPAVAERLVFLDRLLPLPVLETSHFIGSLAGIMLMLLARGLQWRLDAAYVLTLVLLLTGIAASLLKGLDYEEALILLVVFLVLLPSRPLFFRRASLFSERFSSSWITAILITIFAATWLGFFAFHHVEYSHDLWWHFSLSGEAPRFMRAEVGVLAVILIVAIARLLKPAPPPPRDSDQARMEIIRSIVTNSPNASANLALLGDKRFLLNPSGTAFIMYGVSGQSWVAMGDPIGPEAQWPELIWQFHHDTQRYADRTVFYEISHQHLHYYLDLGLVALKLGEEARVPLSPFSLKGSSRKHLRYEQRKMAKQGGTFEVISREAVDRHLDLLKPISDAWLSKKNTKEKGFSLGFFDRDYIRQNPVAMVRVEGRPVAFATIWQSGNREELTVDLMRYSPEAPGGIMHYLFIELLCWGHDQGFQWFNLGMVPLSGLENRDAAPLWHKLGNWVARHGEHFYNFQGLRQFKQKFDPVWQPKYLACPGGMSLPRTLADIGALVSGGLRGVFFK